jgi:hypothetical protein
MKLFASLCTTVLACGCLTAASACENPPMVAMPDGATATMDQLLEAQGKVKTYMAAMEEYLACLNTELEAEGNDAPAEFKALMVTRHNTAVSEMESIAVAFNTEVQAYKAANPPPVTN